MAKVTTKKSQSVRQKAAESSKKPKARRLRTQAGRPIKGARKIIGKILSPLSFLLIPFRTRPARFVGRILGKVLLFSYFRNSWKELRQVTWPNRKQTFQLTFAVFMFAIVFLIFVTVIDFGLDKIFRKVFLS